MKMKKIVVTLALFLVLICGEAFAEITPTPNLIPIETALKKADLNTLVIFDVNDVLITHKDQILQPEHKADFKKLAREHEKRYSHEELQKLDSIISLSNPYEVVDIKSLQLIHNLQKRGIKVLALTKYMTGSFGNIPSLENWRVGMLENFGYTFKNSWSTFKSKTFAELQSKDPKRFPVFKSGVLFTNGLTKGETLKAFLQYADFSPEKIIFIDNNRKYLESVETFAKEAGIPFIGFEYTAIAARPKTPLDEKRARLQFEILGKEHKWLNDQEANLRENQ